MTHVIIFEQSHPPPPLMSALIDPMALAFGEASFESRVSVCEGWAVCVSGGRGCLGPGTPRLSTQTGRFLLCEGVPL